MISGQPYQNRREAGQILSAHLREEIGAPDDTIVLALPRGGVPVGFEVARSLDAPLDVLTVRKLGAPGHEEFAIGAIAARGSLVLDHEAIADLGVSDRELQHLMELEHSELARREHLYRGNRPPLQLTDQLVILIDDGLATGLTMQAAIGAVRKLNPRRIVVAAPVGSAEACDQIEREVGTVICPLQPRPFYSVGLWYRRFEPTTDEEVRECLAAAVINFEVGRRTSGGN